MASQFEMLRVKLLQWGYANGMLCHSFSEQETATIRALYGKWKMTCELGGVVQAEEMNLLKEEEEVFLGRVVEEQVRLLEGLWGGREGEGVEERYEELVRGLRGTMNQMPIMNVEFEREMVEKGLKESGALVGRFLEGLKEGGGEVVEGGKGMKELGGVVREHGEGLERGRELMDEVVRLDLEEQSLEVQIMGLQRELEEREMERDMFFGMDFGPTMVGGGE